MRADMKYTELVRTEVLVLHLAALFALIRVRPLSLRAFANELDVAAVPPSSSHVEAGCDP